MRLQLDPVTISLDREQTELAIVRAEREHLSIVREGDRQWLIIGVAELVQQIPGASIDQVDFVHHVIVVFGFDHQSDKRAVERQAHFGGARHADQIVQTLIQPNVTTACINHAQPPVRQERKIISTLVDRGEVGRQHVCRQATQTLSGADLGRSIGQGKRRLRVFRRAQRTFTLGLQHHSAHLIADVSHSHSTVSTAREKLS
eukprot:2737611-Prymnesium_polylepis.1